MKAIGRLPNKTPPEGGGKVEVVSVRGWLRGRRRMESAGGMNSDVFAALYAAERGNFWFEPRNRLIVERRCSCGGVLRSFDPQADQCAVPLNPECGSCFNACGSSV
jgi:hypothetical protein